MVIKGSPCFMPWVREIKSRDSPLRRIVQLTVETHCITRFTHLFMKPNFSIIFHRNSHSTRLYALLMLSFTAMWPTLHCLPFLNLCSISYAIDVLEISLFGTKALYESEMMFGRRVLTLFAKTLDTKQLTTLLKLIRRQFVMVCGSFIFGMSKMCVKFFLLRTWPELRTNSTTSVTSPPTMCQYF